MRKHFVEIQHHGTVVSEYSTHEVESRNPDLVELTGRAYAFRFFDEEHGTVNGKDVKSVPINQSPWHYLFGSRIIDLATAEKEFVNEETLLQNMRGNGYNVIILPGGRMFSVENDAIILKRGN